MATIAFFLLIATIVFQIGFVLRKRGISDPVTPYSLPVVLILLVATTVRRSIGIDFIAITSIYEALILFAALIILVLVAYRWRAGKETLPFIMVGGTLLSIILLAISSSPLISAEAVPPVPALRSNWLVLHILFAFFGEAFFTLAFLASLYYLLVRDPGKKEAADILIYKSVVIGYFLFTTGGLFFGSIWAYNAWGRYWGWDPKETSAFVTWLVYTLYLHLRLIKKLRGKATVIFSIVGFILTLFTFLGVNFLMKGLHGY